MDKKQIMSIALTIGVVFLEAAMLAVIFKLFGHNAKAIIEVIAEIF